jgi:hypothetical protein
MQPIVIEEIDLAALTDALRARLGSSLEASYLRGKTLIRDAIVVYLQCSEFEAEQLVETLELHGLVRFPHLSDDTHPSDRRWWQIGDSVL